ncbi:hypothetical protein B0H14DRAFT_3776618 [Mycena olivaceomarginata]|nr:hypothetical protein B0H14DRAFT_3776618 [Mycena olivaceomarginata]
MAKTYGFQAQLGCVPWADGEPEDKAGVKNARTTPTPTPPRCRKLVRRVAKNIEMQRKRQHARTAAHRILVKMRRLAAATLRLQREYRRLTRKTVFVIPHVLSRCLVSVCACLPSPQFAIFFSAAIPLCPPDYDLTLSGLLLAYRNCHIHELS